MSFISMVVFRRLNTENVQWVSRLNESVYSSIHLKSFLSKLLLAFITYLLIDLSTPCNLKLLISGVLSLIKSPAQRLQNASFPFFSCSLNFSAFSPNQISSNVFLFIFPRG